MNKYLSILIFYTPLVFSKSFINSYDLKAKNPTLNEFKVFISDHAKDLKSNYLSLGESHLHSETAHLIQEIFINEYLKENPKPIKTCLEDLKTFRESSAYTLLERESKEVVTYLYNSPSRTDFKECFKNKNYNYVTYSGFYHQYPFARDFYEVFIKTPVITQPGNNINEQMGKSKGLFITQVEFEYLEFLETKALLNLKLDLKKFKKEASLLIKTGDAFIKKMENVISHSSPYKNKDILILKGSDFRGNLYAKNNYFVFTNFSYRNLSFRFLRNILSKTDQEISTFLKRINSSRLHFATMFIPPREDGTLGESGYGVFPHKFRSDSYIIHSLNSEGQFLYTFSSYEGREVCYEYESAKETSCY